VLVEDQETERITRLWVAEDTRLPLKRTIEESGASERVVVSYGKSRAERHELPSTWFATPRPTGSTEQREQLPPEPQPQQRPGEMPREEQIAMARAQRSTYGMNTNEAHVAALYDNATTAGTADHYGFPVDAAEQAEFQLRSDLEQMMPTIDAYGASVPDAYGGVELDPSSGQLLVHFTKDLLTHVNEPRTRLGVGTRLQGRSALHTLQHLEGIEARLQQDVSDSGRLFGEDVSSWGVDVRNNRVEPTAPAPSPMFLTFVATTYHALPLRPLDSRSQRTEERGPSGSGPCRARSGRCSCEGRWR